MKKKIINIIEALVSFAGILISSKLIYNNGAFNFWITLSFFFILYFYLKTDSHLNKREKKYTIFLSVVISFLLSLGSIVSIYIDLEAQSIFNTKNSIYFIVSLVGLYVFFYKLFGVLIKKVNKISLIEEHNKMSKKTFILITLALFAVYFLYFIRFYPAIMTPDSYYVIHYANNFILSDYHPFGHTWFFGVFFHLGKFLFHNLNMAVAFSTIIQMIIQSLIFSNAIRYFYNKGLKKCPTIVIFLIYALSPLHAYYSITLWRDILFSSSFVITLISLYEFITNEKRISKKYIVLFIISMLIMMFFRNNGIYIFIFIIPFIIYYMREKRILFSIISVLLLAFYFIIKGPVFDYYNVERTTSVEAYSIPLQQMARVIASSKEIPKDDYDYLNKLFKYDRVKDEYKTYISDPIKSVADNKVLSSNKKDFFKTYISLMTKYPNIYFDAYFLQTLGYWYPDIIYNCTAGESVSIFPSENIYSISLTPKLYNEFIDMIVSRNIPLSNLIWSVGLHFILFLTSTTLICYFKKKKYLLCLVPIYGLWLSIMVATPVFCELRYIYGMFTCMPLIIFLPFIIKDKRKEEKAND